MKKVLYGIATTALVVLLTRGTADASYYSQNTGCTRSDSDLGLGGGVFVAGTIVCQNSYSQYDTNYSYDYNSYEDQSYDEDYSYDDTDDSYQYDQDQDDSDYEYDDSDDESYQDEDDADNYQSDEDDESDNGSNSGSGKNIW